MLQTSPTTLEVDSDSEDEKTSNNENQDSGENTSEKKTSEEKTISSNKTVEQIDVKTSNEGEDDEDDGQNNDKCKCHCVNPLDYIDINGTKYFDTIIILSSFVNFILNIILLNYFYKNNQWAFFGTSLSFHILTHLCYILSVHILYDFKAPKGQSTQIKNIINIGYFVILLLFSPFINLLIYLTSADHLILAHLLKPILCGWNTVFSTSNDSSWYEKQIQRLVGYVIVEVLLYNLPQLIIELFVIHDCIYNSNSNSHSNYNSSMIFYLFLTFYINLFCIIVKLYVPFGSWFDSDVPVKEIFILYAAITADFLTAIYLIIWMYVLFSR